MATFETPVRVHRIRVGVDLTKAAGQLSRVDDFPGDFFTRWDVRDVSSLEGKKRFNLVQGNYFF